MKTNTCKSLVKFDHHNSITWPIKNYSNNDKFNYAYQVTT